MNIRKVSKFLSMKIIFLIFISSTLYSWNGNMPFQWLTYLGSIEEDYMSDFTIDESGRIYIIGRSRSSWDNPIRAFSPGSPDIESTDVYVAAINSNGHRLWVTFLGSTFIDFSTEILYDGNGNLYISGHSQRSWGIPKNAYTAAVDGFVAKLGTDGNLQWNTFLGGIGDDVITDMNRGDNGKIYLTGHSSHTWGSPLHPHSGGFFDNFILVLDSDGNIQNISFTGAAASFDTRQICIDSEGNAIITGISDKTWGSPIHSFSGQYDAYIAKVNPEGKLLWNTFYGYDMYETPKEMAIDSQGNILLTGMVTNTKNLFTWPPQDWERKAFIIKCDPNGNKIWERIYPERIGIYIYTGESIYIDSDDGFLFTGEWTPGDDSGAGSFIAKMDKNGTLLWEKFLYYDKYVGEDYRAYLFTKRVMRNPFGMVILGGNVFEPNIKPKSIEKPAGATDTIIGTIIPPDLNQFNIIQKKNPNKKFQQRKTNNSFEMENN